MPTDASVDNTTTAKQPSWVRWGLVFLSGFLLVLMPINFMITAHEWEQGHWNQVVQNVGMYPWLAAHILGPYGFRILSLEKGARGRTLLITLQVIGALIFIPALLFNSVVMIQQDRCRDQGGLWDRTTLTCNK